MRGSASLLFCHFRFIVILGYGLNALSCSCHFCHYVADCHYVGVCHVTAIPSEAVGALHALSRIPRTIGKVSGERLCTRSNLMRSRAVIRERHSLYLAGREYREYLRKHSGKMLKVSHGEISVFFGICRVVFGDVYFMARIKSLSA